MKMRKNYGQDLCGKNKSYHKPFRVLSETVGIFMESERRQRTGTETCKDCDQQEQNLYRYLSRHGEAKLDSLAVKAEMNLEPCTRYYWKVIVTTDADEVLESDVQFFETAKRTSRGWENGLPATAGWNAIPFSQSESFPVER